MLSVMTFFFAVKLVDPWFLAMLSVITFFLLLSKLSVRKDLSIVLSIIIASTFYWPLYFSYLDPLCIITECIAEYRN